MSDEKPRLVRKHYVVTVRLGLATREDVPPPTKAQIADVIAETFNGTRNMTRHGWGFDAVQVGDVDAAAAEQRGVTCLLRSGS